MATFLPAKSNTTFTGSSRSGMAKLASIIPRNRRLSGKQHPEQIFASTAQNWHDSMPQECLPEGDYDADPLRLAEADHTIRDNHPVTTGDQTDGDPKHAATSTTCLQTSMKWRNIDTPTRIVCQMSNNHEPSRPRSLSADHCLMNMHQWHGLGRTCRELPMMSEPEMTFRLPRVYWQWQSANALELPVSKFHRSLRDGTTDGGDHAAYMFQSDDAPAKCHKVDGDGNCLFRSLSFWVTGSVRFHPMLRRAIVSEIQRYSHLYTSYTPEEAPGIEYLRKSRMAYNGVWGTDVETTAAATMLRIAVAVYAPFGNSKYRWQIYHPLGRAGTAAAGNDAACSNGQPDGSMMYLRNAHDHFEPVEQVKVW